MSVENQDHSKKNRLWPEIILLLPVMTGIYFIIGDINLGALFSDTFFLLEGKIAKSELSGIAFSRTVFQQIELSDIVGISIITWALVLAVMRFRHRLVTAFIIPDECPECGSPLRRNDRTTLQRIFTKSLVLKSKSYYCTECDEKNIIFRYKVKGTT